MKKQKSKKTKYSNVWQVKIRPEIAKEFTYGNFFDDNLAGLHEIRARMTKEKILNKLIKTKFPKLSKKFSVRT